jgi:hypothetical protein
MENKMKLSSRRELLKESQLTLKSIKESLNEGLISVKGKMIGEPEQYVVRCHTVNDSLKKQTYYANNMKVGYYMAGEGTNTFGTDDINKATVHTTEDSPNKYTSGKPRRFLWGQLAKDFLPGDFFEPVPVDVKITRTITIKK